ncbi:MAG TPA: hypothetical protein VIJ16_00065 [Gemmatimonadaceae bacterium]
MSDTSRKWAGRGIQLLLALALIAYLGNWLRRHVLSSHRNNIHVSALFTVPDTLGPGDIRIYNEDSTVDLLLIGNKIAAGLSPMEVAKIRKEMDSSSTPDSGLAGSIASMAKRKAAEYIGTHAAFALSDLRDVTYDGEHLNFEWKDGSNRLLFDNTRVNGKHERDDFRQADAQRFIDAVHARQKTMMHP